MLMRDGTGRMEGLGPPPDAPPPAWEGRLGGAAAAAAALDAAAAGGGGAMEVRDDALERYTHTQPARISFTISSCPSCPPH